MSIKENKDLVRRMYSADAAQMKANNTGKDPYLAPEFIVHGPPGNGNLKEFQQSMLSMIAAFPDLKFTVEDIIAEKDKVVTRVHTSATHKGVAINGIAPKGKKLSLEAITIHRIVEGRIVEMWLANDRLGMMQQLGALPSAPAKK